MPGLFLGAWSCDGICLYVPHPLYQKLITLALLPAVVCVVIMLVNGNVGTGVAVAGAFSLVRVKSTNMGSMFKLTYNVMLRDVTREKEMIDKIRCRNGNLEITVSKQETVGTEL